MNKIITLYTYPNIFVTNKALVTKYNTIASEALKLVDSNNKKTIILVIKNLYKLLNAFYKENVKSFSKKERIFFNALINLTMQLNRFFKIQKAEDIAALKETLTLDILKEGILDIAKKHKINSKISFKDKLFSFNFIIEQPNRKGKNPFKK